MLVRTLYHTISTFNDPGKKSLQKTLKEKENAGNQQSLLFPQCLLLFLIQISIFQSRLCCRLQALSIWTSLEMCRLVKVLSIFYFSNMFTALSITNFSFFSQILFSDCNCFKFGQVRC